MLPAVRLIDKTDDDPRYATVWASPTAYKLKDLMGSVYMFHQDAEAYLTVSTTEAIVFGYDMFRQLGMMQHYALECKKMMAAIDAKPV